MQVGPGFQNIVARSSPPGMFCSLGRPLQSLLHVTNINKTLAIIETGDGRYPLYNPTPETCQRTAWTIGPLPITLPASNGSGLQVPTNLGLHLTTEPPIS